LLGFVIDATDGRRRNENSDDGQRRSCLLSIVGAKTPLVRSTRRSRTLKDDHPTISGGQNRRWTARRRTLPTLLATLVAGCGSPETQGPSAPLSSSDSASIHQLRRAFSETQLSGAWRRQAGLFTPDGALLEGRRRPLIGRAAIRGGLGEFDIAVDTFDLSSREVAGNRTLAVDRGRYVIGVRTSRSGPLVRDSGWYLMVLKGQRNRWRIAALTHHSDGRSEADSAWQSTSTNR
jgi:hypothetical protein